MVFWNLEESLDKRILLTQEIIECNNQLLKEFSMQEPPDTNHTIELLLFAAALTLAIFMFIAFGFLPQS